jgi:hypothetical protein
MNNNINFKLSHLSERRILKVSCCLLSGDLRSLSATYGIELYHSWFQLVACCLPLLRSKSFDVPFRQGSIGSVQKVSQYGKESQGLQSALPVDFL